MRRIYLDHSATTPVDAEVMAAMMPAFTMAFANPASAHAEGGLAAELVARGRAQVAARLGAASEEIVFTSGGTESDNLAVTGAWRAAGGRGRILISAIEHPAVREAARACAGAHIETIPVDGEGRVELAVLGEMLESAGEPIVLVAVMHASNELGTLQEIGAVAALCRRSGVPLLVDAVQSPAQVPFTVSELGCTYLSLTAHKIYGPKGVGALYFRAGARLQPSLHGGGQEGGRRPGTLNVPGIVGLGAACDLATRRLGMSEAMAARRDRLASGLEALVPGLVRLGSRQRRLPGHLALLVPGVESQDLVMYLDAVGIAASRGAACSAGNRETPVALAAIGVSARAARGMLRLTLGHSTTDDDIDQTLARFPSAFDAARRNFGGDRA